MRLKDLKVGQFASREFWLPNRKALSVTLNTRGEYWYCENFVPTSELRKNSSGYSAFDFVIVKETKTMDYANNIMVVSSQSKVRDFENEEKALEYIQDSMDENPKLKFKIFKAYKAVEPKRFDIVGLIKDIIC